MQVICRFLCEWFFSAATPGSVVLVPFFTFTISQWCGRGAGGRVALMSCSAVCVSGILPVVREEATKCCGMVRL